MSTSCASQKMPVPPSAFSRDVQKRDQGANAAKAESNTARYSLFKSGKPLYVPNLFLFSGNELINGLRNPHRYG